jgi:hypothetical protein
LCSARQFGLRSGGTPTFPWLVRAAVERVDGVRFRELFGRLPQRAATGDEALDQVLKLVAQRPDPATDIEGT